VFIGCRGLDPGWAPAWSSGGRHDHHHAATGAALAPIEPPFSHDEQAALAGFLAGYTGLTRDVYTLDLRQYTSSCTLHGLRLFAARRVDIETFRGEMETAGLNAYV
jgi:hypothetical protein